MIHQTIHGDDVPALGLGTWRLSGRACRDAVADALAIGYRHVDTAQAYENETEVGQGIADSGVPRDALFVTTKVDRGDLGPAKAKKTVEESLRRLGIDYVDLLLIHWPSEDVPMEHTLDALLELREAGKTRHLGVSNFTPSLLRRALRHAPIFCNQVEYHPFLSQAALLALAREHDVLLTAYSPVARGEVTKDATLQEIAGRHGKSTVQVALRWLVQQDHVAAIPKAASPEHRRSNFELFDFHLTDAEMAAIHGLAHGRRIVDPDWAPAWEQ